MATSHSRRRLPPQWRDRAEPRFCIRLRPGLKLTALLRKRSPDQRGAALRGLEEGVEREANAIVARCLADYYALFPDERPPGLRRPGGAASGSGRADAAAVGSHRDEHRPPPSFR